MSVLWVTWQVLFRISQLTRRRGVARAVKTHSHRHYVSLSPSCTLYKTLARCAEHTHRVPSCRFNFSTNGWRVSSRSEITCQSVTDVGERVLDVQAVVDYLVDGTTLSRTNRQSCGRVWNPGSSGNVYRFHYSNSSHEVNPLPSLVNFVRSVQKKLPFDNVCMTK